MVALGREAGVLVDLVGELTQRFGVGRQGGGGRLVQLRLQRGHVIEHGRLQLVAVGHGHQA
jgi:hypothetical protein